MAIVAYIYTKRKGEALLAFAASKYRTVGMAHESNVAVAPLLCFQIVLLHLT